MILIVGKIIKMRTKITLVYLCLTRSYQAFTRIHWVFC